MPLKKLFRNDKGQVRNGWWILLFLTVFVASQWVYRPVSHGLQYIGITKNGLAPLPVVFLLLVTWICMLARRQPLSGIGLSINSRWVSQAFFGAALGSILMLVVAAMILLTGGVRFELAPAGGLQALAYGLWVFIWAAVLEELLFRGFLFQRLVAGLGAPFALFLMASLFTLAHWGNPGMDGASLIVATIDTGLAAVLLGLAYLRTGSLALPIGIHIGWNWTQGSLLGFDVSGQAHTGWLLPHLLDKPQWLSGGVFGPEASVFAVVIDAAAVLLMWRWKGMPSQARPA